MMEICRSRGVHCFGCNSDAYELDPQTWLSACITDWSGYIPYLKQAIDGEYEPVNISGGMELTGVAEGLDETGALLVREDDGTVRRVLSGDVSVRGVMGYV